jgi:hypothetical protein
MRHTTGLDGTEKGKTLTLQRLELGPLGCPNSSLSLYITAVDRMLYVSELQLRKKNVVLWGVTPRGSCENPRFGEPCRFHHQGETNQRARNVSSN